MFHAIEVQATLEQNFGSEGNIGMLLVIYLLIFI